MKFDTAESLDPFEERAMKKVRDQIAAWLPKGSHFIFLLIEPGLPRKAKTISSVPRSAAIPVLKALIDAMSEKINN